MKSSLLCSALLKSVPRPFAPRHMARGMKGKHSRQSRRPPIPKRGTRAAASFFGSWQEINRFFSFVMHLVGHVDAAAERAHTVLVEVEDDQSKRDKMVEEWKGRRSAADSLRQNRQFFLEAIFVRHIENFLNYLSSLLYEIFVQRPETLRTSDKIEVASVLKHDSIESLVRDIAERKVEALSYSSFKDLTDFFEERFHITIADASTIRSLSEAIEIRNISVHNRCIINKRFVSRLALDDKQLGQKRELYIHDLDQLVPLLSRTARALDKIAATKLKLKGVRFTTLDRDKPA